MSNLRLVKALTLTSLSGSLTAAEMGFYPYLLYGLAGLLIGFLLFLLATNKKSILTYYAKLETAFAIQHPNDSVVWGVKPKYRAMAPYVVPLGLFFGFYGFSFAIAAANGAQPGRNEKLIYDLFGVNGVVFLWFMVGLIVVVGSAELAYYLWKTRKNA